MSQVILIRPGPTLYDEQNRIQGVLDIPLSESGRDEVERMARELSSGPGGEALSALYCGPGENVTRTAEIIGKILGLRPRRVNELRNLDQGLWQGLQIDEVKRRNAKVFRQWIDDPSTICPPRGETVERAMERIKIAFRPLLRRHQDETIGLVVGEPLACLVACYLRCEPRAQLQEHWPCCEYEWIQIAPVLLRDGSA